MAAMVSEFLGAAVSVKARVAAAPAKAVQTQALFGKKAPAPAKKAAKAASKATNVVTKQASKATSEVRKAASKATSAAKKAVKSWGGGANDLGLEQWYGPNRKKFLPSGLLDDADIPSYLSGEIPGDYGYDPLGLGQDPAAFEKYRANELIHARWAMLGAAGAFLPEAFNSFGTTCGPEAVWWKTGAQLLEPNSPIVWFGIPIPIPLVIAVVVEVVLMGAVEQYRAKNESPLGSFDDTLHPGGPFDPFGLADDPEIAAELKVKEIKNGRLAMVAMLGFAVQALVTKEGPYANWAGHVADPFGYNLVTILGAGAERLPSL
eukprot:jgi/Chlat1/1084/Chrsp110S01575